MTFTSLEPFVPSGKDFQKSKELFRELGFKIEWEEGGLAGLEKDGCRFILQKYDVKEFAENLMLIVRLKDVTAYWKDINERKLGDKFNIRIGKITQQPYGKEMNIIDIAGVCWHFVE